MAYEIIGNVYKVGTPETIMTKSGNTIKRRSLTLEQKRYDPNTGEEFNPNYPTLEFSGNACDSLNNFHQGDRVRVRFDITGVKYDKDGEERYLTILRGFRVESYVSPFQSQGNGQQPQYQQQPPQPYQQQYQPQAQQQQYQPQPQEPFPPQYNGKVPF